MHTKVGHADLQQMAPGMEGGALRTDLQTVRPAGVPEYQPKEVRAPGNHFLLYTFLQHYIVLYIVYQSEFNANNQQDTLLMV